ncbi:MAG: hypothetical protein SAJ72_24570 [Jaaginema sp. PMC 1080.18]|nr:hypothetical protein [Jaaginema sp. PMC 1080.18]MEC4869178.1 hypothetical protein [Jaaginema sp. PMC 1078.18]
MIATNEMPEKRPGQDVIRFYLPEGLKETYKRLCAIKGTTMSEDLIQYVEQTVKDNERIFQLINQELENS